VDIMSVYSADEKNEIELYSPFSYYLMAIGLLHEKPIDAPDVVECVKSFYDYMMNIVFFNSESADIEEFGYMTIPELLKEIGDMMEDMLADSEFVEIIDKHCGENSAIYIAEAVKAYCISLTEADLESWKEKAKMKYKLKSMYYN